MATDSAINSLTDLSAIDAATFASAEAYVSQLLTERFPDRDFGPGSALYWSIVIPTSAVSAAALANARLTTNSFNIENLKRFPEQANEDLADLMLANYYVSRNAGAVSTGSARYVVSRFNVYAIQAGSILTANGRDYTVPVTITAYTDPAQAQGPNDRVLAEREDGNWEFTVPVQSVDPGVDTYLPRNAAMVPQNPPSGTVSVQAATDISGGSNDQTLADFLAEIPAKFAASTWGSESGIRGIYLEQYPNGVIWPTKFGDPEMLRDKHNPLAIAQGGFSDVWLATQRQTASEIIEATAVLVDSTTRKWEIRLGQAQSAGVYFVDSVSRRGENKEITAVRRGFTTSGTINPPIIQTSAEAAFSAFQTLTIELLDPANEFADLVDGDELQFDVSLVFMPEILTITTNTYQQDLVNPTENTLVRAVVPCVVDIALLVRLLDGDFENSIDVNAIKTAIVDVVTNIGLGYGILSESIIMKAIHDFLTGRSDVDATTVTLNGTIYAPTDELMRIGGSDQIAIPDLPDSQVTKRTTMFFTDLSRIDIQFTRVST